MIIQPPNGEARGHVRTVLVPRIKPRVEACSPDGEWGRWWWVNGCEHKSPGCDFPTWREAMHHALTCGWGDDA